MKATRFILLILILLKSVNGFCVTTNNDKLTLEQKIYGLSLFWKEASYNFAYFDQVEDLDWDKTYITYLSEVANTKNNFEYYRVLSKLAAELNDGMTYVNIPKKLITDNIAFPRIKLAEAEQKAIVIAVDEQLKKQIPIGSIILSVDKRSTSDVLKNDVFPYISSSTNHIKLDLAIKGDFSRGYGLLAGEPGSEVEIKLQLPDKSIKHVNLTRNLIHNNINWHSAENLALAELKKTESVSGHLLENDIFYVSLNNFSDIELIGKFKAMIPKMQSAKGLVLDLRFNRGGNTMIVEDILKHLTFHDLTGAKSKMRIHNATFKAWGKYAKDYQWAKKYETYFLGQAWTELPPDIIFSNDVNVSDKTVVPTAILISRNTSSSAENFLIYADGAEHFTTIGEPTFGSTGQPLIIDLPGGGSAKICTKRDSYPDGRDFVGYGIKPDIYVARDISYYLSGDDLVLTTALNYLKQQTSLSYSSSLAKNTH